MRNSDSEIAPMMDFVIIFVQPFCFNEEFPSINSKNAKGFCAVLKTVVLLLRIHANTVLISAITYFLS